MNWYHRLTLFAGSIAVLAASAMSAGASDFANVQATPIRRHAHRRNFEVRDGLALLGAVHRRYLVRSVTDYAITDFGVLHEVFPQSPMANLSMGVHVYGLGTYNLR